MACNILYHFNSQTRIDIICRFYLYTLCPFIQAYNVIYAFMNCLIINLGNSLLPVQKSLYLNQCWQTVNQTLGNEIRINLKQKKHTILYWSDDKLVLNVPTTKLKTKTYGDRCFSIAGPNLWNQLPSHIRLSKSIGVFKRSLKTNLFNDTFNL